VFEERNDLKGFPGELQRMHTFKTTGIDSAYGELVNLFWSSKESYSTKMTPVLGFSIYCP
jgi:hypothetical protein